MSRKVTDKEKLLSSVIELQNNTSVNIVITDIVDVNFEEITRIELNEFTTKELTAIKVALEKPENNLVNETEFFNNKKIDIDTLEILERYIDHDIQEHPEYTSNWRDYIPPTIKRKVIDIASVSMRSILAIITESLPDYRGKSQYTELAYYSEELLRILSERNKPKDIKDHEAIEIYITKQVEMIMLPYLDVLEEVDLAIGEVMFIDNWPHEFKKNIESTIMENNNYECVICSSEDYLMIHHIIPENYGGTNYQYNLVTLCQKCNKAIETTSLTEAIRSCTKYFYKSFEINKSKKTGGKHVLRKQIESNIHFLIENLDELTKIQIKQKLLEVQDKIDVVFYE